MSSICIFFLFFLTHNWDVIQILLSDKQRRVHSKRDDALMKMHYAGRVVCVKKKWVSCAILLTLEVKVNLCAWWVVSGFEWIVANFLLLSFQSSGVGNEVRWNVREYPSLVKKLSWRCHEKQDVCWK